eukprot:ANDGO_03521.mRNA.1 Coiled-coil domain-containing protein 39
MDSEAIEIPGLEDLPFELLNDKNRGLAVRIKDSSKVLSSKTRELEELYERLKVIQEHMKNVSTEVSNTKQLVDAKKKELESEKHLRSLSERELSRFTSESAKLEKSFSEIADQINVIQNNIFRSNEKMDEFKLQMDFNQEELEQWALAEKQKNDDAIALEKYHRQDDKKLKTLTLELEKLTSLVNAARSDLETEITETQSVQIELDKAAEDFRTLHSERQLLVSQWEEAISSMQKRDFDIQAVGERFASLKMELQERKDSVTEKEQFLQGEMNGNRDLENQIANLERVVVRGRTEFTTAQADLRLLEDELEVVRSTLAKQSAALFQKRAQNQGLLQNMQDQKRRLESIESEFTRTEDMWKDAQDSEANMEQRMLSVEKMLADSESTLQRMDHSLEDAKKEQYKRSTELHSMREKESVLHSEIAGVQSQNKNLQSKLQLYDAEAFKQQELLYNIEFQIQQMERKVSRIQGERTEEEKRMLKEKIEDLQQQLDEKGRTLKTVNDQLKKVGDEVRRTGRLLVDKTAEEKRLEEKINELNLENENEQLEIRASLKNKESLMVQHDLLKLQVKKVRDQLNARKDELMGLENRKEQFRLLILERVEEVSLQRESLRAELKCISDEKHKLLLEMKDRQMQVDKLRTKFDMLVQRIKSLSRFGNDDSSDAFDDSDEGPTQAQFLIRIAQQREELQRQGDDLDSKIAKLEKEEKALKKTMSLLQAKNADFSASVKKADLGGPDAEKKLQLEEKIRAVRSTVQAQRKEIAEIEGDNTRLDNQIQELEQERVNIHQTMVKLQGDEDTLRREIGEHSEKMGQYEQKLSKLRDIIRPDGRKDVLSIEEKDVACSELKNKNKEVVQRVLQIAQANSRVSSVLEQLMSDLSIGGKSVGKTAPSRTKTNDRPDSARSVSSDRSVRSNTSVRSSGSARQSIAPKQVALGL